MPFASLTPEQRTAALQKAVQVRSERARLKKDLKSGALDLQTILNLDGNVVGRMKVVTILESLPKFGKVRARKVLDEIGINELRRVQGLTPRQRRGLEEYFGLTPTGPEIPSYF